jgi:hypothetical protein
MKMLRLTILASLAAVLCCSCETSDGGRKKKRTRPPLPGEDESSLSWNRPTRSSEISSPFGLPTSR